MQATRNPLFHYNQVNKLEELDRTPGPKTSNYPAECLVEDCLIYLTGRVEKQTAGVQIQLAAGATGVLVLEVPVGSTLARAGLRTDDVLLTVNGTKAADAATLLQEAPALAPFQALSLGISRQQKESTLTVTQ